MPSVAIRTTPLFLIGFMGTGKSVTGTLVAARLGRAFVDLDIRIEQHTGNTIGELFAAGGEVKFREVESETLRAVLSEAALSSIPPVVAVGGGAPAHHGNMDLMLKSGIVVCLRARPETILARVGDASTRPILARAPDKRAEAQRLLYAREPFYSRAHISVDTDGLAPSQVAKRIVTELEKWR